MSSDYLAILQLHQGAAGEQLDRAYLVSRARLERLTDSGPFHFFREALLAEVERAYQTLKRQSAHDRSPDCPPTSDKHKYRSLSILARRVANQSPHECGRQNPTGSLSGQAPDVLERRTPPDKPGIEYRPYPASPTAGEKALIEDEYCREVIVRLEGELLRYDSRRELLKIAHQKGIVPFRANLLMAQIVEAVRQNKLYLPSKTEQELTSPPRRSITVKGILVGIAVILAVVADLLAIRLLGR